MSYEHDIASLNRRIRNVFGVLARGDFSPIGTRLGHGSREDLPRIWNDSGYKVGAEVGVQKAIYSSHILRTMPGVLLHCIDPWMVYGDSKLNQTGQERNNRIAMERLKPFINEGRCTVHRETSNKAINLFEDCSLDFVFIDGDHSFDACVTDLINYVPKVRRGGMVAVHDYNPMRMSGVLDAVNGYTKCHLIAPWYVIREQPATAFWVKG